MEEDHSHVSDRLGHYVLAALCVISALCFLIAWLTGKPETNGEGETAADAPPASAAPEPEPPGISREDLTARLEAARATRNALQRDLDAQTRERVDLDGEVNRLRKIEEELDRTRKEIVAAGARLDRSLAELGAAKGKAETLATQLESAQAGAVARARTWAQARSRMETEGTEARSAMESERAELVRQINSLKKKAGEIAAAAARFDGKVEVRTLKARVVSLEQKLDTLGNQRNELARALRAARVGTGE